MPGFIGLPEILLLGLVVLLVFGPKRLPEMGRSMGRGLREFKSSVTGDESKDSLTGDELNGSESDDELEDTVTSKERDADTDLDLRTIRLDGRRAA